MKKLQSHLPEHWGSIYTVLPWLFLVISIPAVYLAWQEARTIELNKKHISFERLLDKTSYQFVDQIKPFEQSLVSIRGFFEASDLVKEAEFESFVKPLFEKDFAVGLSEVGFIKSVSPLYAQTYRALEPKYHTHILSYSPDTLHAPVIYRLNKEVLLPADSLHDAFAVSGLKQDLTRAAKQNALIFSQVAVMHSVQPDKFSLILPVYKQSSHTATQEAHSAALSEYGWIYVTLDLRTIFHEIFGTETKEGVQYALYDDYSQNNPQWRYASDGYGERDSVFTASRTIVLFGKKWTLNAAAMPEFVATLDRSLSTQVGLGALLVAILLTGILFLMHARVRAMYALENANTQLRLSDERWNFALEGSESGVWDWDIAQNRFEYSPRWRQMFGFDKTQMQGTQAEWERLIHPNDRRRVLQVLNAYLHGDHETYSLEYRFYSNKEGWRWVLSRGMVVSRDQQGVPLRMVGTIVDITQQKETEQQVWQQANFDHLTNLPNRTMLCEYIEREIAKADNTKAQFALMFLDLDGFKDINETLGHQQGDLLIQQVALRLSASGNTRKIVARLGGDEFMLLVPCYYPDESKVVEETAKNVLAVIADVYALDEDVFVTASIGVGIYPDDATTVEGLMQSVDQAMYASKARGGNCFTYFKPEMQEVVQAQMRLARDLRSALAKQQLFVQYQPIIDLGTGEVYKAEALIRWQHPEIGLVSPAEFIPIAEDTKLINEIGNWVFCEAIKQSQRWRKQHDQRFQVAVNKSAVQFMHADPTHSEWIEKLPATTTSTSNPIVVEITESLLLDNTGKVAQKLKEYRERGIKIALDDFGTGYSAFAYLRKFEIDYLKIDRSFVANMEKNSQDSLLCKAIIDMAHSLGLKVVAEGIETLTQYEILKEAKCDYGQGYYFSKPLNPSDFDAYLAKQPNKKAKVNSKKTSMLTSV